MEEVGTVPERAAVGNGAGGLQRERGCLELLPARPRAIARLPLGRGRPGRHLRRPAAPLLCARAVERQGSDPEGAPVRAEQQRGEPRRGREGVLLLPRLDADPLVHEVPLQVPPGGLSVRRPGRDEPRPRAGRAGVRAARHGRVRRATATSTSSWSMPRRRPRTCSSGSPCTTAARNRRRSTSCPRSGSATTGRGEATSPVPSLRQLAQDETGGVVALSHRDLGERYFFAEGASALLFTENETNTERLFGTPNRVAST